MNGRGVSLAAGKSQKYVHDARVTVLDKFADGREQPPIHLISAAELESWVDGRVQVAKLIGFDMSEAGEDWERDGLRKNCATHLRVIYRNDYDVVKDMGNSVRILLKHYAALHTPEEISQEYWRITPEKVEAHARSEEFQQLLREAAVKAEERRMREAEEAEVKAKKAEAK